MRFLLGFVTGMVAFTTALIVSQSAPQRASVRRIGSRGIKALPRRINVAWYYAANPN